MNNANITDYIALLEPIKKAQEVFNSKWKLPIIITLLAGNCKFNEIGRSLPSISSKILIKELRELQEFAIVKRTTSDANLDIKYSVNNNDQEIRQIIEAYRIFSIALSNRNNQD